MESKHVEFTYDVELQPGEQFRLPDAVAGIVGPGHWIISIRPADSGLLSDPVRDHSAFLNSYVPEDEGLYDDYSAG